MSRPELIFYILLSFNRSKHNLFGMLMFEETLTVDEKEIYERIGQIQKRLDNYKSPETVQLLAQDKPTVARLITAVVICFLFLVFIPINTHKIQENGPLIMPSLKHINFSINTQNSNLLYKSDNYSDEVQTTMGVSMQLALKADFETNDFKNQSIHHANDDQKFNSRKPILFSSLSSPDKMSTKALGDDFAFSAFSEVSLKVAPDERLRELFNLSDFEKEFGVLEHRVIALVLKSEQKLKLIKDGKHVYTWKVSTARSGKTTPNGTWAAQWLSRHHKSSLYNDAPMPYSIFYNGNYAIHGTTDIKNLGTPASAGCVRLDPKHAQILFELVESVGKSNFFVHIVS